MDKVSVALTTYQGARYILKQLQSLACQSRPADEVIICDDGSRDGTVDIVRQFIADNSLEHWHVYENQTNLGFVQNFRKALSLTSGDIVFLCDQDDIWLENKISRMAGILEGNPAISALACGYRLIDGEDRPIPGDIKKFYAPKSGTAPLAPVKYGPVLYYNIAQGCAGAYRRKLVNAFCAVEQFGAMPHDWALNLMAHQTQGLYFLQEELLLYRIHGHNAIGIDDKGPSEAQRVQRLGKYAAELEGALYLPLSQADKEEIRAITAFTKTRIHWLRDRRPMIWIRGFAKHFPVLKNYFFWQYGKDLALVVLGRIPKVDEQ